MWFAPAAIVGLAILRAVSLYLQTVQTNRLALTVMQDLQNAMFAKLVRADFARLQGEPVGSLVSRFTNDITLLRETLIRLTNNLLRDVLQVIATIGWMLWLDWMLTLLVLVVYPLASWPVIRIGQRLRKTSNQAQSQMGAVTSQLEESFPARGWSRPMAWKRPRPSAPPGPSATACAFCCASPRTRRVSIRFSRPWAVWHCVSLQGIGHRRLDGRQIG